MNNRRKKGFASFQKRLKLADEKRAERKAQKQQEKLTSALRTESEMRQVEIICKWLQLSFSQRLQKKENVRFRLPERDGDKDNENK